MVGLMIEVRRAYRVERDQTQELAVAYAAERQRVEELEAIDRTRAELHRMATHELMHPVSVLRSWIVTLQRRWSEFDDGQKVEVLKRLDVETQRLRDLAERTPEVTGAGGKALIFPIAPVRRSVLELVKEARSSSGLDGRLTVDLALDPMNAFVRADTIRILQVLWNLFSNAIKHGGPDPRVELHVRRSGSDIAFTVADRGAGIPAEDLGRVFDLAYRAETRGAGAAPGSGLGLYISRRIVEAHHGRIWAERRPGRGTAITFTLPIADGER
jgi:two-component system OmpR family sensor kinase